MSDFHDTIVAVASPPEGAARGIVRVSGPAALECLEDCLRLPATSADLLGNARPHAIAAVLQVPLGPLRQVCRVPVDLLIWPTARSYTRQPALEIHAPGAPPLLQAIVDHICRRGVRAARPGEFTLRAFLAGRIDLAQAEAVLGVIDARGNDDLQTALRQLAGGMTGPLHTIRELLLGTLAEIEAALDFAEEDLEFLAAREIQARLSHAHAVVELTRVQLAARSQRPARPRVLLAGPPNAGKSSLFNRLAARFGQGETRAVALVADLPGTTRDYVTAHLQVAGLEFELLDSAGVEIANRSGRTASGRAVDALEAISQEWAGNLRGEVDLVLWCLPPTADGEFGGSGKLPAHTPSENVRTKLDLVELAQDEEGEAARGELACSGLTGAGIDRLAERIRERLGEASGAGRGASVVALTARRCAGSLHAASVALADAVEIVRGGAGQELVAAEVREALLHLGEVVGTHCADDVLDRVFAQFCIGK